jgi:hypothetical protein
MEIHTIQRRCAQIDLFHAPSNATEWHKLPRDAQQATVRLLARLLREASRNLQHVAPAKEVRDE